MVITVLSLSLCRCHCPAVFRSLPTALSTPTEGLIRGWNTEETIQGDKEGCLHSFQLWSYVPAGNNWQLLQQIQLIIVVANYQCCTGCDFYQAPAVVSKKCCKSQKSKIEYVM